MIHLLAQLIRFHVIMAGQDICIRRDRLTLFVPGNLFVLPYKVPSNSSCWCTSHMHHCCPHASSYGHFEAVQYHLKEGIVDGRHEEAVKGFCKTRLSVLTVSELECIYYALRLCVLW